MAGRKRQRLSDRSIRSKEPGFHADGDGLELRVTSSHARSWVLRTLVQGKRRELGLGGWPAVSLKSARETAQRLRKIAREGGDPFIERDKSKTPAPMFAKACELVHADHSKGWKEGKHADQWINSLRDHAIPVIGKMRVDAIKSGDVMRALGPIWLEKPETARRVLQRISTVLLWAKGHGFRSDSPSDEIAAARKALPKQKDRAEHHAALAHAKVADFIARLRESGASHAIKLGLEFLILTAARTNEVLSATWPEVNFKEGVWTIPAKRMKAEREHRVPLSDRCLEILVEARKLSDEPKGHIFPGTISGKPLSNMVFLMTLRRMGLKITAHGFRSSFRDWCSEKTNAPRELAEAALAHVVADATEAAYRRTDLFEKRRELMSDWARYCGSARGKVIPLGTRSA